MSSSPLAVVTGASSGIGRAIATSLAERGYRTVLIAREEGPLSGLAAALSARAPSRALAFDLRALDSIPALAEQILAEHGVPMVLVNNAGIGNYATFLEEPAARAREMMTLNYEAPAALLRGLLPAMLAAEPRRALPHVFNISSMSARLGPWGHSGYAASKAALKSLSETLAQEVRGRARVTCVYPGIIRTAYFEKPSMAKLWPMVQRRAIAPERVAAAVVGALGTGRTALYVPRHYRMLDAIIAVSPRLAMRMVRGGSAAR
ncbi:SDR family NAD(P)-dependent oxidoreductase [soil metagenome]